MTLDEAFSNQIREDYTQAKLDPPDRAMLDYVAQLTKDATKITKDDINTLRKVGFDDRSILHINLLASMFNYLNRVADGLGVGR